MAHTTDPPFSLPLGPFSLEEKTGYRDTSVEGGLGALVARWAAGVADRVGEAGLKSSLEKMVKAFAKYGALEPEARQDLIVRGRKLIALLDKPEAHPTGPAREADARPVGVTWAGPVTALKGCGPARAKLLAELGIATVADLLQHYPARHDDRREIGNACDLAHRETGCVLCAVTGPGEAKRRGGRVVVEVPAEDEGGAVTLTWFNQPYRATQFDVGTKMIATGQAHRGPSGLALLVAEVEMVGADVPLHSGRLVPMYPLTSGLGQAVLRRLIHGALEQCPDIPTDRVPVELAAGRGLADLPWALANVHFPDDDEALARARERIVYEELFLLQASLAVRRRQTQADTSGCALAVEGCLEDLRAGLPFTLTGAQERVIGELLADVASARPAHRLIHGDVGSGKTVVALAAMLAAARNGAQAALMAPTELLAEQHGRSLTRLLEPFGMAPALLTGSMSAAERQGPLRAIAEGTCKIVVGTHALFQEAVRFRNLAVVVVDEQHRFGVRQRAKLAAKGRRPHVFVMSATPIPRTLALTAYGDYDVSVLDEMPPGRTPIHTEVITRGARRRAHDVIYEHVNRGRQAYIVCPLVDDGQEANLASAEELFDNLARFVFPKLRLGLVHGKLRPEDRLATMQAFHRGEIDILIATTVIEVGVDVPNAVVMMVENAERFGLAQLHQLRGRVGRGTDAALCLLVTSARDEEVISRLQVLEKTTDGFVIAEEDMRRRGPGEMAGVRQSGMPDLRMADLLADTRTLVNAREDAFACLEADPALREPRHAALREHLRGATATQAEWTL